MWCRVCASEQVAPARLALGYTTCLTCGETKARQKKHTIAPMAKSNYVVITNPETLKQLNKYAKY